MGSYEQLEAFGFVWMQICAVATVTGGVVALIAKIYRWLRKPAEDNAVSINKLVDSIAVDKRRIEVLEKRADAQEEESKLVLKALMQLMSHEIDGNHTAQLAAARDDIQRFLIER